MDEAKLKIKTDSLEPSYRAFVLGNIPTIIAEEFGRGYDFDTEANDILVTAVFLLLIFAINEDLFIDFVSQGCSISREEASSLFWGIVTALPEPYKNQFIVTAHEINNSAGISSTDLAAQIVETESAIATLPTIRTMNQAEPVYSSTQAALLREGRASNSSPSTPSPTTAAPATPPTWDSAR